MKRYVDLEEALQLVKAAGIPEEEFLEAVRRGEIKPVAVTTAEMVRQQHREATRHKPHDRTSGE